MAVTPALLPALVREHAPRDARPGEPAAGPLRSDKVSTDVLTVTPAQGSPRVGHHLGAEPRALPPRVERRALLHLPYGPPPVGTSPVERPVVKPTSSTRDARKLSGSSPEAFVRRIPAPRLVTPRRVHPRPTVSPVERTTLPGVERRSRRERHVGLLHEPVRLASGVSSRFTSSPRLRRLHRGDRRGRDVDEPRDECEGDVQHAQVAIDASHVVSRGSSSSAGSESEWIVGRVRPGVRGPAPWPAARGVGRPRSLPRPPRALRRRPGLRPASAAVGEVVVRVVHSLELLLGERGSFRAGRGVSVGVPSHRGLAVGRLDLGVGGARGYAEDMERVHGHREGSRTMTRPLNTRVPMRPTRVSGSGSPLTRHRATPTRMATSPLMLSDRVSPLTRGSCGHVVTRRERFISEKSITEKVGGVEVLSVSFFD